MDWPALARRLAPIGLAVAGLLLFAACDRKPGGAGIDAEWHRQSLMDTHLARWFKVAPTESGLFRTAFNRNWQEQPNSSGDLTGQSRLVYALLAGYEASGDRRYLETALRGADALLDRFRDPVHGGYFNRVAADGKVLDANKRTYAHAFVLFALSHTYRVSREERFRLAALAAWRDIDRGLRDAGGGFRPAAPRDFAPTRDGRNQNPVMHLFEALLALCEATGDREALAGAASLGNFVVGKLLQGLPDGSAYIPEWYDENWQPRATREQGGYIDIGHQFEWSHLLLATRRLELPGVLSQVAPRLLQYALKVGYDEVEGGAYYQAFPDGGVDRRKFWWEQAECLRALLAFAQAEERRDLWRRYEQTLDLVKSDFIDPENGGWRFGDRRVCEHGGCPDTQPDPYHMAGMHLAALRAAAPGR